MASSFERYQKRRLISSYFSVVLSVFLVLFLLGMLSLFIFNSKKLSNEFKEEIPMIVFFKESANKQVIDSFGSSLASKKFIKNHSFVSKEDAAASHKEVIGEDFMQFLGFNPLQDSYDINFHANFVEADSIKMIETEFKLNPHVSDVVYDKHLVELVNDNIETISFWMLVASGVLGIIAVLLINSSMRLSIYSNRFIIKTMQMVGATKSFIRRPFILRSIQLGILSSILAIAAIIGVLYWINENYPKLHVLEDKNTIGIVLGGVLIAGILISWFSTFFATQRFLNLKTDDLY